MNQLLRLSILTLAGMAASLTAHAEIQVFSNSCSYGSGGEPVAICPSIGKTSPDLLPNEVISSESSGRYVLPATVSDPTQADVSLSAVSRARADYGSLGIYASVVSTGSATGAGGVAETTAWATFNDTLTVTSSLLPFGSPVTLRYDFSLNRSVNISESYQTAPTGHASGYLYTGLTMSRNGTEGVNQNWCAGDCSNLNLPALGAVQIASAGIDTFSGQMQLQVGDVVSVFSSLSTFSRAILSGITFATPTFGTYSTEVRSFDSAHPYFRIEGQDAFLVAASGHDYTMPVPEPGTYALLLAGLAMIGQTVRRRAAL